MQLLWWTIFPFSFLTIWAMRWLIRKFPKAYFYFGQIVINEAEDISFIGLAIRFLLPMVIAILIAIIYPEPKLYYVLFYGFLTPFLLIWPAVLNPEVVFPTTSKKRYKALGFIYLIYLSGNMSICLLGYYLYSLVLRGRSLSLLSFLNFYSRLHPFFQNLISSSVWAAIALLLVAVYRFIMKKKFKGRRD